MKKAPSLTLCLQSTHYIVASNVFAKLISFARLIAFSKALILTSCPNFKSLQYSPQVPLLGCTQPPRVNRLPLREGICLQLSPNFIPRHVLKTRLIVGSSRTSCSLNASSLSTILNHIYHQPGARRPKRPTFSSMILEEVEMIAKDEFLYRVVVIVELTEF